MNSIILPGALRAIKGVTLRDQVRSSTIREELKIQDIVRFVRARMERPC